MVDGWMDGWMDGWTGPERVHIFTERTFPRGNIDNKVDKPTFVNSVLLARRK